MSIAEKLTLIAENQQRVYDAGYEAGKSTGGSSKPVEVATESEMTALLTSGEVGGVYKYVGTTTETYENGGLYIIEAVSQ